MKLILLALFSFSIYAGEISITAGTGTLEGEDVHSFALDYKVPMKKFKAVGGEVTIGPGIRLSHFNSSRFFINDDANEYLAGMKVAALNIAFFSQYKRGNFKAGFNIDLVGGSTGSDALIDGTSTTISPKTFNLLLGGEKDKGFLNSEFWIGYKNFRLGTSHIATEYDGLPTAGKRQKFYDTYFLSYNIVI
jgi:hypothetical protein